ncbi:MAG: TIGR03560 family F420-dependent LLM class oxidoreductase [Acidimicrobiales bacterium]
MRFGTMVPQGWKLELTGVPEDEQWERIRSAAHSLEETGWDSLWVYDHFHTHPIVAHESVYDAWTLMAALAVETSTIRIGQMCTCVLYRQPSLLAKLATSVDAISGGRLEVAIGAGWSHKEFAAYGYDYPRDGVRLDMLEETAQILKEMWTTDEAHFEGEHYSVAGAITRPRSLQKPHPPLWICGPGEKRTLKIVAKYGDYSNFGKSVEQFEQKSEILAGHCEDVGRDFNEIRRTVHIQSIVGSDRADLDRKLEIAGRRRGCSPEEFEAKNLVGTPAQVAETIAGYADAGCYEIIPFFYDMGEADSLEMFNAEVMSQFR